MQKPQKPTPDFPLFAHANGQWAKKIAGRLRYFGPWADPLDALANWGREHTQTVKLPRKPGAVKPRKPRGFPLYAHANGQWAKKVRGETRFFGPWADQQAALNEWLDTKDDLLAGREPRTRDGLTVRDLVNHFLESRENAMKAGELTERSFSDYDAICGQIIKIFGRHRLVDDLRPEDFAKLRRELAKGRGEKRTGHGPTTLLGDITRSRVVFNFAYKQNLIPQPIVYGDEFSRPKQKLLRRARNERGPRLFTSKQIRAMIDEANPQLKAMILLGINCGLGNHDCSILTLSSLDLDKGWLDYPRPKTEMPRRAKLWPETVTALKAVLRGRKDADLVFTTKYGNPWLPCGPKTKISQRDNPITKETSKLIKKLGFHRKGLSFYALRHTFETIAGESLDQPAVDFVMGHAPKASDMSAVYRERMHDKRLFRVAKFVRSWLLNKKSSAKSSASADA